MAKAKRNEAAPAEGQEVALLDQMNLPAVVARIKKTLGTNLRGETLDIGDLEMIKLPSQGLTVFTRQDENGNDDLVPEITGILLYQRPTRSYYSKPYTGGRERPDCYSDDCITGIGSPGGDCATCPLNEFGSKNDPSKPNSRAKACAERRLMFMLTPGSMLPIIVRAGTGSMKSTKQYLFNLSFKKDREIHEVITTLFLTKETSDGTDFSMVRCRVEGELTEEQIAQIVEYRDQMMPLMDRVAKTDAVKADDANGSTGTDAPIDEEKAAGYMQQ